MDIFVVLVCGTRAQSLFAPFSYTLYKDNLPLPGHTLKDLPCQTYFTTPINSVSNLVKIGFCKAFRQEY
jgi:hypothetical protein